MGSKHVPTYDWIVRGGPQGPKRNVKARNPMIHLNEESRAVTYIDKRVVNRAEFTLKPGAT